MRLTHLEIHKEELAFSAGHFTIFSATEREPLHGHNYYVSLSMTVAVHENGLSFDYRHYKDKLLTLCKSLDNYFLLPKHSPYLELTEEGEYWIAHFNKQRIPFLKQDVLVLPLSNITIEELSRWFLDQLLTDEISMRRHGIEAVTLKVYNGPGQSGGSSWEKSACGQLKTA